jgi:4'-phosphopantetheinyl transferase
VRFRFDRDRRRFIVARAVLRCILADYLRVPPAAVRFSYGKRGKPALPEPWADRFHFNLSHSGELALIGVTGEGRIGVDIEEFRPVAEEDRIAERFFSPREHATLVSLPKEQQQAAFFNCWTRKEAYIKALGDGLSCPLDRFDVTLGPDEPPRLVGILDEPEQVGRWTLYAPPLPVADYAAAVIVEGHPREARQWWRAVDATAMLPAHDIRYMEAP